MTDLSDATLILESDYKEDGVPDQMTEAAEPQAESVDPTAFAWAGGLLVAGGLLAWAIFGLGGMWAHLSIGYLVGVASVLAIGWAA